MSNNFNVFLHLEVVIQYFLAYIQLLSIRYRVDRILVECSPNVYVGRGTNHLLHVPGSNPDVSQ